MILGLISTHDDEILLELKDSSQDDIEKIITLRKVMEL